MYCPSNSPDTPTGTRTMKIEYLQMKMNELEKFEYTNVWYNGILAIKNKKLCLRQIREKIRKISIYNAL